MLRSVGEGIKSVGGGVVDFATTKPQEIVGLIKKKFKSADNILLVTDANDDDGDITDGVEQARGKKKSSTLPRENVPSMDIYPDEEEEFVLQRKAGSRRDTLDTHSSRPDTLDTYSSSDSVNDRYFCHFYSLWFSFS